MEEMELKSYGAALSGTYDSCDVYLEQYPGGKHVEEVRSVRVEKYLKAEEEYYYKAVNGSFIECDRYIKLFPDGRFLTEVIRMRTLSHRNSEDVYYMKASEGDLGYCEAYLRHYPAGQHREEIGKLRNTLFENLIADVAEAADLYTTLLLERLIKTDSSGHKKAGYFISSSSPFILYVEGPNDNEPDFNVLDDTLTGNSFNHRSFGFSASDPANGFHLLSWDIRSTITDNEGRTAKTLTSGKDGFVDFSGLKIRLETGHVKVEGWTVAGSARFEMVKGVIIFRGRTKPGEFQDGSRCIVNNLKLVYGRGGWSVEL
jgi:hypothetical protein